MTRTDEKLLEGFTDNIRRLRRARGLSQARLAVASGVSRPTIACIENGSRLDGVSLRTLARLGKALKVPMWVLLAPSEARNDRVA
jgi:transcriptional regulator with XRE-family HTH domain